MNGVYERMRPILRTPENGALTPVYLATDDEAATLWSHSEDYLAAWL